MAEQEQPFPPVPVGWVYARGPPETWTHAERQCVLEHTADGHYVAMRGNDPTRHSLGKDTSRFARLRAHKFLMETIIIPDASR